MSYPAVCSQRTTSQAAKKLDFVTDSYQGMTSQVDEKADFD
jgi:hypothetical protein